MFQDTNQIIFSVSPKDLTYFASSKQPWSRHFLGEKKGQAIHGPSTALLVYWMILWMEQILHHQKDGWNPKNNGINHLYIYIYIIEVSIYMYLYRGI